MLEIHLYGSLRRYGPTSDVRVPCVVTVEAGEELQTVGDLVARLGIPQSEVGSVFKDGWWQPEGLLAQLGTASRVGLFPHSMSLLYV